ncbi:MAG TPA: peptidoglycan-binding domain-containing protein [Solirubrobacterales bacterium]|nr:peptidoglycan-binding domain-containing protein [Solirubrobacterales bacterium]
MGPTLNSADRARAFARGALCAFVFLLLLAPGAGAQSTGGIDNEPGNGGTTALDRPGMWIWYVSKSQGGDPARIAARAHRSGIGTVYIKSGDSDHTWAQFNRPLVAELKRRGLGVCAWQFVYGNKPFGEAKVGAASVRRGADCLVIDAEGHYEGRYAAADRYIRALRARIGRDFPLSLASFPYVDYHPAFPYSVFMGPGGAQYNQPQMYWRAIGTSVRTVYEHTYLYNRVFQRPIYPIGQTYGGPTKGELKGFRRFAVSYDRLAPSWWSWQETSRPEWRALGSAIPGPVANYRPIRRHPVLRRGNKGDLVVWAQMHLVGAGASLPITGLFGPKTQAAVRAFQRGHGLTADGVIGQATWRRLLLVRPQRPRWSRARSRRLGRATGAPAVPLSASLAARGYEIDPGPRP